MPIASDLAIGNPADGFYARQTITGSGGYAAKPNDDDIIDAMRMLAETEGIFTETAGGVTLGATKKLLESGHIGKDDGPNNDVAVMDDFIFGEPQPIQGRSSSY